MGKKGMNDLISREALLGIVGKMPLCWEYGQAVDDIYKIIKEQPAVDAQPVRHGKNVTATHPHDMFVCSDCGFSCEITELRYDEDGMGEPDAYEYDCKFCPNCGARMDAEVKE